MPKKYKISSHPQVVQDKTSTKFHVRHNDYFGTIATVLRLIKEELQETKNFTENNLEKIFIELEKDLLFLQKNYYIQAQNKPKIKNKNNKPKGKLKSQ